MKSIIAFIVAMAFIASGFMMAATVFAAEVRVEKRIYTTDEDVNAWVGRVVRNSDKDDIGTVKEFVMDSEGRVSFAVISPSRMMGFGDREIVIPYSALAFNPGSDYIYLDVATDRIVHAPRFDDRTRLTDRSYEVEVYRYYGQKPYWTEKHERYEHREHED